MATLSGPRLRGFLGLKRLLIADANLLGRPKNRAVVSAVKIAKIIEDATTTLSEPRLRGFLGLKRLLIADANLLGRPKNRAVVSAVKIAK
jgi:hypothetical protein